MSKCTPGPWRAAPAGRVIAQDGQWRLQVCKVGEFDDPEMLRHSKSRWEADTHLIAAAPELLEALELLEAVDFGANGSVERGARMARIAIAKAKGE